MSEKTDKIFPAFVKMQAALGNASKDRQGHGYKYADLAECIETAKQPLSENGLAVSQMLGQTEQGTTLITMLVHESGQYFMSEFLMEKAVLQGGAGKNPAQVMGSSITYMRRYAYTAITGMTQADDDAATVGQSYQGQQPQRQQAPQQKREPVINPQQMQQLNGAMMVANVTEAQVCKKYNLKRLGELPATMFETVHAALERQAIHNQKAQSDQQAA
ncbi:ERF family protein [Endozoicomonas sp. GU-1]|uniref:ERF family protein n=1 Tax=Endozoicomonas sp. GU-1 TaxID=3009078 RepID=UPI0022B3C50F|nr:ERF family protein [Endozoicomonas sp. GU-1]WBA79587.1 ERF family protein [Endozoicomonas sp. GU-1]